MAVAMTNQELSERVTSMTLDEFLDQIRPLMSKYERWHVPGFDREDLHQELSVTAWRCWSSYDKTKGSIINVLIRSFENRLGNLRNSSYRQVQPITSYVCDGCGDAQPHVGARSAPTCPRDECRVVDPETGDSRERRMTPVRDAFGPASLDEKAETSAFEVVDEGAEEDVRGERWSPDKVAASGWQQPDAPWRKRVKPDQVRLVERALSGRSLTARSRERLKELYPLVHGLI